MRELSGWSHRHDVRIDSGATMNTTRKQSGPSAIRANSAPKPWTITIAVWTMVNSTKITRQ
jgi:hypothetical protein